jgi:hypothetical protein
MYSGGFLSVDILNYDIEAVKDATICDGIYKFIFMIYFKSCSCRQRYRATNHIYMIFRI